MMRSLIEQSFIWTFKHLCFQRSYPMVTANRSAETMEMRSSGQSEVDRSFVSQFIQVHHYRSNYFLLRNICDNGCWMEEIF